MATEFDISTALQTYLDDPQSILTPEADSNLVDCEGDPDAFTPGLVNSVLNSIVDAIGENPEAITQASNLDSLLFLLKCAPIEAKQYNDTSVQDLHANHEPLVRTGSRVSFLPLR